MCKGVFTFKFVYASSEGSGQSGCVCVWGGGGGGGGGEGILRWFRVVVWSVSMSRSVYAQIFANQKLSITFVCVEVLLSS